MRHSIPLSDWFLKIWIRVIKCKKNRMKNINAFQIFFFSKMTWSLYNNRGGYEKNMMLALTTHRIWIVYLILSIEIPHTSVFHLNFCFAIRKHVKYIFVWHRHWLRAAQKRIQKEIEYYPPKSLFNRIYLT